MQYNKNICIKHSGRLLGCIGCVGSRWPGRSGCTLDVCMFVLVYFIITFSKKPRFFPAVQDTDRFFKI